MVERSELRIGNYVDAYSWGKIIKINGIKEHAVSFQEDFGVQWITCFKPIPLTEEILLKCGIKWKNGFYYVTDEIRICSDTYNVYAEQDNNIMLWIGIECKHLHQLQNLYFALTGQELNVKL